MTLAFRLLIDGAIVRSIAPRWGDDAGRLDETPTHQIGRRTAGRGGVAARNQIRRLRMHARLDGGAVQLLTCTGLDWTRKYPAIAAAVSSLPARLGLSRWGIVRGA